MGRPSKFGFKDDGTPNFALITWIAFCSADPPMLIFALRGRKLTRELVERNGVFSANLVTAGMMYLADYFGNTSGYDRDKCREAGVQYSRGAVLDVPVLEDSPWVHECSLVNTVPCNDGFIYLGAIKNTMVDEGIRDTSYGKVDLLAIDPLIYAPGGYYGLGGRAGSVGDGKKHYGLGNGHGQPGKRALKLADGDKTART